MEQNVDLFAAPQWFILAMAMGIKVKDIATVVIEDAPIKSTSNHNRAFHRAQNKKHSGSDWHASRLQEQKGSVNERGCDGDNDYDTPKWMYQDRAEKHLKAETGEYMTITESVCFERGLEQMSIVAESKQQADLAVQGMMCSLIRNFELHDNLPTIDQLRRMIFLITVAEQEL